VANPEVDDVDMATLGSSGIPTSRLGFGMWPIGGTKERNDYGEVDDQQALAAIRRALDLGVTLFDTAPAYGEGRAEVLLGEGLAGSDRQATVVTKCAVHWSWDEEKWVTDSSRDAIIRSAEQSLVRLRRDVIDVLLIHVPDPAVGPDEPMRAFEELKAAGKVRGVGVSNFSLAQLEAYRAIGPIDVIQVGYHLFDRRMEREMLPYAKQHGIGVMTYGSLAHGLLTGTWTANQTFAKSDWRAAGDSFGLPLFTEANLPRNVAVVERLKEVAARSGHTVAQLAIAWALLNPTVDVALAGARQPSEIEDNADGVAWRLGDDVVAEIEAIMKDAAGTSVEGEYVVNQRSTDS
jgi:aryl-alcohol dehydrogenase-like predicted oxidoreductase